MWKLCILLTCFTGIAHGGDAPAASSYRDFTGGLNTYNASVSLQPNESPDLMNVGIDDPPGALTQRTGYESCGNTPSGNTALALYEYSKNNGSRNLIVSDNNTIWQTNDCIVYSTIATDLGALNLPRFATIQDNLWIVNGSTWPIVWDGTTATYLDGAGTKPQAPKGKLITYWKSRVWIGNDATNPSGLYFTSLVDVDGNILNPASSSMAWANANNLIYFARDNGSPLYAIKVYRDNLYAFKENDILRLVFESEYTANGISVTKTVSRTGSKFQESIIEMDDGLLRFVGRDGVYAFNGVTAERISTKWTPTFYAIKQPTRADVYKIWDTQTDWGDGTLIGVSSTITPGSIQLLSQVSTSAMSSTLADWTVINPTNNNFNGNLVYYKSSGYIGTIAKYEPSFSPYGTYQANMRLEAAVFRYVNISDVRLKFLMSSNDYSYASGYGIRWYPDDWGNLTNAYRWGLYRYDNGVEIPLAGQHCSNYGGTIAGTLTITRSTAGVFSASIAGCDALSATDNTYSQTGGWVQFSVFHDGNSPYPLTVSMDSIIISSGGYYGVSTGTGSWTSPITHAADVSIWKTFDTNQTLNNQTITYDVRTGTTSYNAGIATYRSITPGTVISVTTDSYVQLRANLASTNASATPVLNSAQLSWLIGDTTKSPLAGINYKSRYWMTASTTVSNDYNDLVMVESKSPLHTHTRYNLPIAAFTLWNNYLYGSIGGTPKIARLDRGYTDDGVAIASYWDSRDEVFDNPLLYKSINRIVADYASTPANNSLNIGLSPDLGATWQYQTVNTNNNPVLKRNTSVLNINANTSLQFRTRIANSLLGVGFTLYGLHDLGTATGFFGNK